MNKVARFVSLFLVACPAVYAMAVGCSSSAMINTTGTGGSAGSSSSTMATTGTGAHDGGTGGNDGGNCGAIGAACQTKADCCSGACTGGVCNVPPCTSDNQPCTASADCCSGTCTGGSCVPLNTTCKSLGNACAAATDCCSGLCFGGVCSASSFCGQTGDVCVADSECCGGICTIATGATKGTCAQPPSGASNCGLTDGMLCAGTAADGGTVSTDGGIPPCGGACCSRLCAPYGPTGTLICQPASGCHVVGDLCKKDSDCCGSAGLPGEPNKPVTCDISPPNTVGVCRNPMGCKPDGDICRLATMSCNASCDCCSGNCQNADTCHLDSVGVPRCTAAQCVMAGGACASSANCCNGLPCVPNPNGTPPFICFQSSCVPKCGACSINADCCPGETCIVPTGSSSGVCGPCGPMPDGGTDGGPLPDAGPDSGPLPDAGTPCSLYGQGCSANGDCCNSVPCSGPNGPCQPGQTGCTCRFLIQ